MTKSQLNTLTRNKPLIALAIVSFFWGTTYLASRIGATNMPGLYLAGLRQFLSGIILAGFLLARGHKLPDLKTLSKIAIQGIILLGISNGLSTWSVQYISSGLAAIINALVPMLIAIFSLFLLKNTRFTGKMFLGLVIGFVGIGAIFYEYLSDLLNPAFSFGIVLCLIAITSWSFGSVYSSKNKLNVDILLIAGLQMFFAGVFLLPICFISGKYIPLQEINSQAWGSLLYLIFIGSILSFGAYVYAISKLPPTVVSIYAYINPIVAVALGWMVLDERLNINIGIGTAITLFGVYLVNSEFKKYQIKLEQKPEEVVPAPKTLEFEEAI